MEFIYRRVSTVEQNTNRQLPDLKADREYEDKLSGKNKDRPQLLAMLGSLREGDMVHVHELSRLGRSLKDLLEIVETITEAGASIKFHKENLCFEPNKNDPFQALMFNMISAVAQFERECLLQRQREGIDLAKAAGKYKGRQSRFTQAQFEQIQREFNTEKNKAALARKWGVSRSYLYKIAEAA